MGWQNLLEPLLDFVAPPLCVVCRNLSETLLCPTCQRNLDALRIRKPYCRRCGTPLRGWQCPKCHGRSLQFDRARGVFLYTGPVASVVESLKYQGFRGLGRWMAREMAAVVPRQEEIHGIVPVPLHPARIRERGFSQTRLLARELAAILGVPMAPVLRRVRYTRSQTTLSPQERRRNLRGAFALTVPPDQVQGKTWLLVDDVMTTMTTLNEAARPLRRASAGRILAVLFAIAP